MECVFCKIIKGEIPCSKVYEDEKVIAFLDIMPINKGHTLVVPKKHSNNILEDTNEDIYACMNVIKKITPNILKAMEADGFNIGVNTGHAAGQAVFHTHFHIIPRYNGDGLKHWPGRKVTSNELDNIGKRIREFFEN